MDWTWTGASYGARDQDEATITSVSWPRRSTRMGEAEARRRFLDRAGMRGHPGHDGGQGAHHLCWRLNGVVCINNRRGERGARRSTGDAASADGSTHSRRPDLWHWGRNWRHPGSDMSATMGRLVCSPTDSARVRGGGFVVRSRVVVRSLDGLDVSSSFDGAMEPSAHRPRAHQPPGPARPSASEPSVAAKAQATGTPIRRRLARAGALIRGRRSPLARRQGASLWARRVWRAPTRRLCCALCSARGARPHVRCAVSVSRWQALRRRRQMRCAGGWPLAARRRHRSRRQHRRPEAPRLLGPWHAPESRGHAQLTGGCKCSRRIGASLAPSWAFDFFHTSMKF